MKPGTSILAAALVLASAMPATAAGITAHTPQTVVDALTALGYQPRLEAMDSGRPSIAVDIAGLHTYVDFYYCTDTFTDCDVLRLNVSLNLKDGATPEQANEWNQRDTFGRLWLNADGDPTLDMTLSTFANIPTGYFNDNMTVWAARLDDLKTFFDFIPDTGSDTVN